MPTVRTVFQPDVDLDVSEAEAAVLRAQGLLVDAEPPSEPDVPQAAPVPADVPKTPAVPAATPAQQAPATDDTKGK